MKTFRCGYCPEAFDVYRTARGVVIEHRGTPCVVFGQALDALEAGIEQGARGADADPFHVKPSRPLRQSS